MILLERQVGNITSVQNLYSSFKICTVVLKMHFVLGFVTDFVVLEIVDAVNLERVVKL